MHISTPHEGIKNHAAMPLRVSPGPKWWSAVPYVLLWLGTMPGGVGPVAHAQEPEGPPHPLIVSLGKEGHNVLLEFRGALASGARDDAIGVLTGPIAPPLYHLVPDGEDGRLSLALCRAIDLAINETPGLAETIRRDYAAIGQLRLHRAAASGNPAAVEAVAMLLVGTDAAADAHRWLGDRALSTGRSAEAIGHYRRALRGVSPSGEAALRGRIRLAAAMQGRMAESPVTEPIVVGKMNLDAERFERWVHDLYETHRRHRSDADITAGLPPTDPGFCPPPAHYHGQPGPVFEGTAATTLPGAGPSPADRMARQLAVAVSGGRMFVSDRRNVTAYELNRGKTLWSHHAGISSKAPPWPLVAMQPLVTGRYVTTRVLGTKGPELACFRASDGKLAWQVVIDGCVASDPTGNDERIFAFLATSDRPKELTLSLGTFDPHHGQLLGQAVVAQFHDHWEGQLSCRAVAVDDGFVATAGGAVFCCDRRGRVLWIRRQAWQAAKLRAGGASGGETPLVSEGRVYATQPGVAEIECLDLETGRRYWNLPTPRPMTVVGRVDDLLITAGTQRVVAVDRANGKVAWSREVKGDLHAALCGRPGEIVYLATLDGSATAEAKRPAVLTWLDPKTGSPRKQVTPGLPSGQTGLSAPLVTSDSRWWGLAASKKLAPAWWTIVELTEAE